MLLQTYHLSDVTHIAQPMGAMYLLSTIDRMFSAHEVCSSASGRRSSVVRLKSDCFDGPDSPWIPRSAEKGELYDSGNENEYPTKVGVARDTYEVYFINSPRRVSRFVEAKERHHLCNAFSTVMMLICRIHVQDVGRRRIPPCMCLPASI